MTHKEERSTENLPPGWGLPLPEVIPRPTYWPVIMGLGITFLAFGVATTLLISAVGAIVFVVALVGWIGELLNEHREQ